MSCCLPLSGLWDKFGTRTKYVASPGLSQDVTLLSLGSTVGSIWADICAKPVFQTPKPLTAKTDKTPGIMRVQSLYGPCRPKQSTATAWQQTWALWIRRRQSRSGVDSRPLVEACTVDDSADSTRSTCCVSGCLARSVANSFIDHSRPYIVAREVLVCVKYARCRSNAKPRCRCNSYSERL